MKARMPWFAAIASRLLVSRKLSPSRRPKSDQAGGRLGFERLERREVLSSVVASPIASIHGQLTAIGQPTHVAVSFAAGKLVAPRSGSVYIGLDVEPAPGSTAMPVIRDVIGPSGLLDFSVNKSQKAAFILKVPVRAGKATSFTVDIAGRDLNLGDFVLDAYLPGDVNGNGVVARDDLKRIRAVYGSRAGQTKFDPAADVNIDAQVGCFDLKLARDNLGAQAAVVPQWTATPAVAAPPRPDPDPDPDSRRGHSPGRDARPDRPGGHNAGGGHAGRGRAGSSSGRGPSRRLLSARQCRSRHRAAVAGPSTRCRSPRMP